MLKVNNKVPEGLRWSFLQKYFKEAFLVFLLLTLNRYMFAGYVMKKNYFEHCLELIKTSLGKFILFSFHFSLNWA